MDESEFKETQRAAKEFLKARNKQLGFVGRLKETGKEILHQARSTAEEFRLRNGYQIIAPDSETAQALSRDVAVQMVLLNKALAIFKDAKLEVRYEEMEDGKTRIIYPRLKGLSIAGEIGFEQCLIQQAEKHDCECMFRGVSRTG